MKISIYHNLKSHRSYSASTGLSQQEFEKLAEDSCAMYHVEKNEFPKNFGNQPAFLDGRELLFMLLFYKKVYPTFDVLALSFGISKTTYYHYIQVAKSVFHKAWRNETYCPNDFWMWMN